MRANASIEIVFSVRSAADVFRIQVGQFAQAFLRQPGFAARAANGLDVRSHAVHQITQMRIQRAGNSH